MKKPDPPFTRDIKAELEAGVRNETHWRCPDVLCGTITRNCIPACHNCGASKPPMETTPDLFTQPNQTNQ
jgi:hypothetical protein